MNWTEGHIHLYMRSFLARQGWQLVAGEFPGGSNHHLYPLNVVDPAVARDDSPDPRRHSQGEQVPDLVALRDRNLIIAEAKLRYSESDRLKLLALLNERRSHLLMALEVFASERNVPDLLPIDTLDIHPVLVFRSDAVAPPPTARFSHLRVVSRNEAYFEGALGSAT